MDPDSCLLPFPNYRSKPPIPRCKPPPPPPLFWTTPPLFWLFPCSDSYNTLFRPLPSSQTPLFWLLPPCSLAQIPPLFWIPPYPFPFERPVQCTLVLLREPHIFQTLPCAFLAVQKLSTLLVCSLQCQPPCTGWVVAVFPQFQDALNVFVLIVWFARDSPI